MGLTAQPLGASVSPSVVQGGACGTRTPAGPLVIITRLFAHQGHSEPRPFTDLTLLAQGRNQAGQEGGHSCPGGLDLAAAITCWTAIAPVWPWQSRSQDFTNLQSVFQPEHARHLGVSRAANVGCHTGVRGQAPASA